MPPSRRIHPILFALIFSNLALGPLSAEETWQAEFSTDDNVGDAVTNIGGTFSGSNIAGIIGADRFYNEGYTGQGTTSAVVEAGHVWGGHNSLGHVVTQANASSAQEVDRHATWVGQLLGGRGTGRGFDGIEQGIAYNTDLQSGSIATGWNGSAYALSFGISGPSLLGGYEPNFGTANVINSSWGGSTPDGSDVIAQYIDAMAFQNRNTTSVVSAGNAGPSSNTVGSPAAGYNSISVAALQNDGSDNYDVVASFSSRGPNDHQDPVNGVVQGVRAAVDIAAPGTNLTAAFYGGTTGGNGAALGGVDGGGTPDTYSGGINGTSFAAPIVSAGVSLLHSASIGEGLSSESRDALVVMSVLQNSATKTTGWDNGQVDSGGTILTTQALDYATGAGAMNLDRAYDQYLAAGITMDVPGQLIGFQANVEAQGWDLGRISLNESNVYSVGELEGYTQFNVTLNWLRERGVTPGTLNTVDVSMADLTLQVINLDTNTLVAESASLYNVTEHLSFLLPGTAEYGVQVQYGQNTFGASNVIDYGIAWSGIAIPEPTMALLGGLGLLSFVVRRSRSRIAADVLLAGLERETL